MSDTQQNAQQFPPGVYDVTANGGAEIFRVLSLSSTVPTTQPPFAWQSKREHWFTPVGANIQSLLGLGGITVTYTSDLGSLQAVANALANPTLHTFQLYARGVLSTADWILGVPAWTSPAYFYQSSTTPKMQPLFEVNANDPTKLTHINWFSATNTLTSYFAGMQPGAQIACASKSTGLIPTSGYYYRC